MVKERDHVVFDIFVPSDAYMVEVDLQAVRGAHGCGFNDMVIGSCVGCDFWESSDGS